MRATSILAVAPAVVSFYTGVLHGWLYAKRRDETVHLWFAIAACAVGGMAVSLGVRAGAGSPEEALHWQRVEMFFGPVLLIGMLHWSHALFGLKRPRVEAAACILGGFVLLGLAGGWIFGDEFVSHRLLPHGRPVLEAKLTPQALPLLAGFVGFLTYIGILYARGLRSHGDAVALFVAYCLFAVAMGNDIAVALQLLDTPQVLHLGYLALIVASSAVLVRRFVRSMDGKERMTTQLHELVDQRTAELRAKELQLAHGEQLATLRTLADGVAHRINNPMAFLASNLNRIQEIWHDPAERRDVPEILADCRQGVSRLQGVVAEVLELSARSQGEMEQVDLMAVVRSVIPLVRAEALYRAELVEDLAPVPPVLGDRRLLAQVALQLVLNAIQSIPEGQPRHHRVIVSTRFESGAVRLTVLDTGPAIPPERFAHIFEAFVEETGDRASGPRLAVIHQIVARHRGRVRVESGQGGTRIEIELPPVPESERAGLANP